MPHKVNKKKKSPEYKYTWSLKKPMYIDKKDSRYKRCVKQLKTRGFSYTETWGLDYTIALFVLPRLKCFREIEAGYPGNFKSQKEWTDVLDEMIYSFECKVKNEVVSESDDIERYKAGIQLFAKYFDNLWW